IRLRCSSSHCPPSCSPSRRPPAASPRPALSLSAWRIWRGQQVLLLFGWPAGMPTSPYLTSVLTMGLGVSLGATLTGIGLGARPRSERRGAGAVIVGIIALLAGTAVTAARGSSAIRQVDLVEPAAVAPLGMMLAGAALTVVGASTVRRSPGALIVVGTVLLVVSGATMVGS